MFDLTESSGIMSETRNLTCINCPIGCSIKVELEDGKIVSVSGNSCVRGEVYAKSEVIAPVRVVTSSVVVNGGERAVVSVKTKEPIAKDKIFDCVDAMKDIIIDAPVSIGDIIIDNIANTGTPLVATANVGVG